MKSIINIANFVTALRYVFLFSFLITKNSNHAILSYTLDVIDGPIARYFNVCTKFGDLFDHVCDHLTQLIIIYFNRSNLSLPSIMVGIFNNIIILLFMIIRGSYPKHSSNPNFISRIYLKNNYFNIFGVSLSVLYVLLGVLFEIQNNNSLQSVNHNLNFVFLGLFLNESICSLSLIFDSTCDLIKNSISNLS